MTEQRVEYVVPQTDIGKQAKAEAQLKTAERRVKELQRPWLQVDKHWLEKYGLETAAILAVIRDTIRIGYGVCFRKIPELLRLAGMTNTKRHIRAFHRARESGEFFWARGGRTGRTFVFAAQDTILEAFIANGKTSKGGLPKEVEAPEVIKSRRPTIDNDFNKNDLKSMYVRDFLLKNGIGSATAIDLSETVSIEEVEEGLSKGYTEGVLVKYLRGEEILPLKVSRSADPEYRPQGQFADFWEK